MSMLAAIKARAEINQYLGKTASQDEAKATLKLIAALEAVEVELRALDQVFGKDDDVIHAVITQVRQAIKGALP